MRVPTDWIVENAVRWLAAEQRAGRAQVAP